MLADNASELLPEASFGPSATGRFDFTLTFENVVLSIIPSVLFIILAPSRLVRLRKQPRKVIDNSWSLLKSGFICLYTILQLAVLLYWTLGPLPASKWQLAAAVLVFVNGLLLLILSRIEHMRSVKPSTLVNVYLFLTLLFDCAIARTLWLITGPSVVARLFVTTAAVKFAMLALEAWDKRSILLAQYQGLSPESTNGILGRSVFWWLNPLMKTGFGQYLTDQDLYPIHHTMVARKLLPRAQNAWASANQSKKHSLFWTTLKATRGFFISGMLARFCLIALKYTQPFLIERTTEFTTDLSEPDQVGWSLTGAWALVFIGLALSNGFYYHMTYRFVTSVRGSLCSLIYCKTLNLSVTALDESVAVTLMSTDTENICLSFANLHEVWASPIECGVALYLLYRQLGLAALAPIIVSLIATLAITQLAKYIGNAQKVWVRGIQTRVDVTAHMLSSMKEVKMLGLSNILTKMVQDLRVRELKLSKTYRKLLCGRVFLGSSTQIISPLATFATFVIVSKSTGKPLDVASAYSSLSLIYLLSDPMVTVIRTIPMVSASLACFDRIQKYLLSDNGEDDRLHLEKQGPSSGGSLDFTSPNDDDALSESQQSGKESGQFTSSELLVISDADFRWSNADSPTLSGISTSIRRENFTFIIGSVGSGKSTLIKAMLGELKPSAGTIYTGVRNIAYVGQTPWIQNLTIRQNILGVSNYDHAWYTRVIHACGLEQDIESLPEKDNTKAGSAGVSLSGGQKQRLALARAVYSKEKFVFLDDVFSGQDAKTEEHIHQNLFAEEGIFRESGATVVCITNKIHRLQFADWVIVLGDNGQIQHQGTFEYLQSSTDYLNGLDIKQNDAADITEETKASKVSGANTSQSSSADEDAKMTARPLGEFATYRYYFGSMPIWYSLLCAACVISYGGSFKTTELVLSYWTGGASVEETRNNFYLGIYGMLSGLAIISITCSAFFFLIFMVPLSSEVLHARMLASVMNAPLSFFSKTDVGVTTNRFSQDMSVIDTELPFALIDFAINLTVALMAAILMCVFSGFFAATMPPIIFFCWLLQKFYLKTSRQMRLLDLEAKSPLFTQFLDLLQGLASVRAFSWEAQFKEKYLDLLDRSQRPYYLLFCIQRWLALVLDLMVAVLVSLLMVLVVELRSQFSPKFVALALLNVTSFSQSLAMVIKGWTQLETSFGAVARVKQFCGETENENLPSESTSAPEGWPAHGNVTIQNLTASYTPSGEPVLRDVNLTIPAGHKVGICGRSGSGKSSLVATLLRMLEVSQGAQVEFDGIDITKIPRQEIRAAVAVVPQHPFFLKRTTIRENLVPEGGSGDQRIISVLRRIKMADVVEKIGGLDSPLDLDRLSQGQRQLLCLARAVLADKKIILLDEASSNVDERSEQVIRQVIREEFEGCTVIAIVHRLGAVADFDKVAVISEGRVVEWDDPQALLKRESEFKKLWNLSSG